MVWGTCKDLLNPKLKQCKCTGICPSWRTCSELDNSGDREGRTGFLCASWRVGLYINTHTHTPISHPPPVTQRGYTHKKEAGNGHMLCYQGNEFSLVVKQSSTHKQDNVRSRASLTWNTLAQHISVASRTHAYISINWHWHSVVFLNLKISTLWRNLSKKHSHRLTASHLDQCASLTKLPVTVSLVI